MDIYEYQAKKLFKDFKINVSKGFVAYTPNEAKKVALEISDTGPWVVKAQILAGSRDDGKFADKRAGRKGGIRVSKTIDEVFSNADEMLENSLITTQTSDKGKLVSRVYIEEFVRTAKKFYFSFVIDIVTASVVLLLAEVEQHSTDDIFGLVAQKSDAIFKINLGLQKTISNEQLEQIIEFMGYKYPVKKLKNFINNVLKLFYQYDLTILEINPIGIDKNGEIWALDAKLIFDKNALYKHSEILIFNDDSFSDERERIATQFGFQYKNLNSGIGIITNGNGLALSIINDAKKIGLDAACSLNVKGGVDRDKISECIKLIMTNPKVEGIMINVVGGFLRCNFVADGILSVANELDLNLPIVVRFEGTNKDEAINILQSSGVPIKIATNSSEALLLLKDAIEEDL